MGSYIAMSFVYQVCQTIIKVRDSNSISVDNTNRFEDKRGNCNSRFLCNIAYILPYNLPYSFPNDNSLESFEIHPDPCNRNRPRSPPSNEYRLKKMA
jgi:hypothetical protein